jgi:hypothetical protein
VLRPVALPASGDIKHVLEGRNSARIRLAAGGANTALLSCAASLPPHVPIPQLCAGTGGLLGAVGAFSGGGGGGGGGGGARDGSLFTWGANKGGELGHGDTAKRTVPRIVKLFKEKGGGGRWVNDSVSTSVFDICLGTSHAVSLVEWRGGGAGGRGGGERERGRETPSSTSSCTGSRASSLSSSAAASGASGHGWGGRADVSLSPLLRGSSISCPSTPLAGGVTHELGVSPPTLKLSSSPAAKAPFNGGFPCKGGDKNDKKPRVYKPRYSAGGGLNCREMKTPKSSKEKKKKEPRESSAKKATPDREQKEERGKKENKGRDNERDKGRDDERDKGRDKDKDEEDEYWPRRRQSSRRSGGGLRGGGEAEEEILAGGRVRGLCRARGMSSVCVCLCARRKSFSYENNGQDVCGRVCVWGGGGVCVRLCVCLCLAGYEGSEAGVCGKDEWAAEAALYSSRSPSISLSLSPLPPTPPSPPPLLLLVRAQGREPGLFKSHTHKHVHAHVSPSPLSLPTSTPPLLLP